MHQLTYRPPYHLNPLPPCSADFTVAGGRHNRATVHVNARRQVLIDLYAGTVDDRVVADAPADEIERLVAAAANDDAARDQLAGIVVNALDDLSARREAGRRRRWEIRAEYDTADDKALRATLRLRSVTTGKTGSADFALPVPHTYALVCSTAFDEVAVLLDEGHGHEDYIVPDSKGLGGVIDDYLIRAQRGEGLAIETLRSYAVEGIKQLRARRESQGRG